MIWFVAVIARNVRKISSVLSIGDMNGTTMDIVITELLKMFAWKGIAMSRCGECRLGCHELGALYCEENLGYEQCIDRLQDALYEIPTIENIEKGVSILGVTGTMSTGDPIEDAIKKCKWRLEFDGAWICRGDLVPCLKHIEDGRCDTLIKLFTGGGSTDD